MRIGAIEVSARTAIVAEIGNNHEGDVQIARQMVRSACDSGAHAVKFQAVVPERLVRPSEHARIAQLRRFQLDEDDFRSLHDLTRQLGMGFLCTPFDVQSVGFLAPLVDAFKIASGDNDFQDLLEAVAATGRPVIVSTGMSDLATIRAAKRIVEDRWRQEGSEGELAFLHCVSAYPVQGEQASLSSIPMLARELGCTVGYSDHMLGVEGCIAAAAIGASIIEKHFTLRHDLSDFRDHQLSAEPSEMRKLVDAVAALETMLGAPRAGVMDVEADVARAARRSLVAGRDLPVGHRLVQGDIDALRPGGGTPPTAAHELLDRTLIRALRHGNPIGCDDVE
jgi:sialic acid synthase SpsE